MLLLVLVIILVVLLYILGGVIVVQNLFDFDKYRLDPNPIWKIPVFIFWPIALAVVHVILLVSDYIDEIEAWRWRREIEEMENAERKEE